MIAKQSAQPNRQGEREQKNTQDEVAEYGLSPSIRQRNLIFSQANPALMRHNTAPAHSSRGPTTNLRHLGGGQTKSARLSRSSTRGPGPDSPSRILLKTLSRRVHSPKISHEKRLSSMEITIKDLKKERDTAYEKLKKKDLDREAVEEKLRVEAVRCSMYEQILAEKSRDPTRQVPLPNPPASADAEDGEDEKKPQGIIARTSGRIRKSFGKVFSGSSKEKSTAKGQRADIHDTPATSTATSSRASSMRSAHDSGAALGEAMTIAQAQQWEWERERDMIIGTLRKKDEEIKGKDDEIAELKKVAMNGTAYPIEESNSSEVEEREKHVMIDMLREKERQLKAKDDEIAELKLAAEYLSMDTADASVAESIKGKDAEIAELKKMSEQHWIEAEEMRAALHEAQLRLSQETLQREALEERLREKEAQVDSLHGKVDALLTSMEMSIDMEEAVPQSEGSYVDGRSRRSSGTHIELDETNANDIADAMRHRLEALTSALEAERVAAVQKDKEMHEMSEALQDQLAKYDAMLARVDAKVDGKAEGKVGVADSINPPQFKQPVGIGEFANVVAHHARRRSSGQAMD